MRNPAFPSSSQPFIAWSYSQDLNAPSAAFRQTCEKHLHATLAELSPVVGEPELEGIVVCDRYERGFAVAALLDEQGVTLPTSAGGTTCDQHFNEDDLCSKTNDFAVLGRMHEGARGLLVTLPRDTSRRLMLLDQRQVSLLLPMGKEASPEGRLAVIGLLAHEMAHARDYAAGRPGRPSSAEVSASCKLQHVDAVTAISDMALAEYIATRVECAAQVTLQGACSSDLTSRIETMTRKDLDIPPLDASELPGSHDPSQRPYDLSHVGNVLGTLAAYAAVDAAVMGKGGALQPLRTSDQVRSGIARRPRINSCVASLMPVLEAAATSPSEASRRRLAEVMESTLVSARSATQERVVPRKKDTSLDDWFDGF